MEQQVKNKKRNGLAKRILRLSATWQTVIVVLLMMGVFTFGYCSVILIEDICDSVFSKRYYVSRYMENRYEFRRYSNGHDRIVKKGKLRAVLKDVEWVDGAENDSLWIVAKDGRYACFNTNTGQLTFPFTYRKAWRYSEGVAAVLDDDTLLRFIDAHGNLVFQRSFPYNQHRKFYYQFHNQMCQMLDTAGKVGLIDISGDWVVEPKYDSAAFSTGLSCGYWLLMRNDSLTVIDSTGHILIDLIPGQQLKYTDKGDLEVWHLLYPGRLFDAHGNMLANQTYWMIDKITYYDNGDEKSTGVLAYYTEYEQCGLMSIDGKILTEARFDEITAIDKNLFRAKYSMEMYEEDFSQYDDASIYVLLNDKGERVEGNVGKNNNTAK